MSAEEIRTMLFQYPVLVALCCLAMLAVGSGWKPIAGLLKVTMTFYVLLAIAVGIWIILCYK